MVARRVRNAPAPEPSGTGVPEVLRSAGKPLAAPVRREMEARLGADFSGVRLHTGAAAARSARAIGARAYTSGSHVVIGAGGGDKHTLAHELTHVIQQSQGPVSGTDHGDGLRVSDPSDRFERAAEANARRVMSGPVPVARAVDERAVDEHVVAHRPAEPDAVQRLVGFEAELSVPSFGTHDTTGLNPVDGRAPASDLGAFFHGGLDYATPVVTGENLRIVTDHNSLSRRLRDLYAVLANLTGRDGAPVVTGRPAAAMSNLEYVTAPVDEMAPGSDATVKQLAEHIEGHVGQIFGQQPTARMFMVPHSANAATGTPLAALQQWLGPDLYGRSDVQEAIRGFQADIKQELYIQATVGVLPSGLPSLYSYQAGVSHDSRRNDRNAHIADGWRAAAVAVNRAVSLLRSNVVPALLNDDQGSGDKEALTGTLALGVSYAIGSAMVEAGVRGATSTTKNAVPFLLKMANLGAIRQQATTDLLRRGVITPEQANELAAWIHQHIPETGTAHWQAHMAKYPQITANPGDPVYDTRHDQGRNGVANTARMLHALLNGTEDFEVVRPGRPLENADKPNDTIVPHVGGQKGAPLEMRWISERAAPGQLWPMLKKIMDEARKANLATVPSSLSQEIWKAATDLSANPAAVAQGSFGTDEPMDIVL
ncbi:DUF4157 domain-containing protein [Streptomyces sp. NPDC049577]|uniref:eCIS core domain-containing protein n=1 Tax=Streptomyces sp. NPDC049577 TaxID=3155153 RepID=UPI003420CF5E